MTKTPDQILDELNVGGRTIAAYAELAPAEGPSFADKLRDALLDSAGLDGIPEPDPLVDGILFRDSLAWLPGKPGHGKSFVALDVAGCVGTGEPWQGYKVVPGPVVYIAAEGVSGIRWRVRAWEQAMGRQMTGVKFLPMPVQVAADGEWDALIEVVTEIMPALIVVDTQARVTVGMEENAASDMGVLVHKLEKLRTATRACVLVVHHQGRNGEHMRGSTALDGAATTILQVTKEDTEITVKCAKQKDAEEFDEIKLRLVPIGDSAVLEVTDATDLRVGIAAMKTARAWWDIFAGDEVSISKLAAAGVAAERTLYRHVATLRKSGFVLPVDHGSRTSYRLAREPL